MNNNQSNNSKNTQKPITKVSPIARLRTHFSKFSANVHSDSDSIKHKFQYLIGNESKTLHPDGTVTYAKTPEYLKKCELKQQKAAKVTGTSKPSSKKLFRRRSHCINVRKISGFSLLMPILLLALREFLPGIEEHIPNVYAFLDAVIVPIIEWIYKIGMKAFAYLTKQELFVKILEFLKALAA